MLFDGIRYKQLDDARSFNCNVSKEKLLSDLKEWFQKQRNERQIYSSRTGILGWLNIKRDTFIIKYRFGKPFGGRSKYYHFIVYIRASVEKVTDSSCTVNYSLVHDNFIDYGIKMGGLATIAFSIYQLFWQNGMDDLVARIVVSLMGLTGLFIMLEKSESKSDVIPAIDILEGFLKSYE